MEIFDDEQRIKMLDRLLTEDPLFSVIERQLDTLEREIDDMFVQSGRFWVRATTRVEEWIEARRFVARLFESAHPDRMVALRAEHLREDIAQSIKDVKGFDGEPAEVRYTLLYILLYARVIACYLFRTSKQETCQRVVVALYDAMHGTYCHEPFDQGAEKVQRFVARQLSAGTLTTDCDYTHAYAPNAEAAVEDVEPQAGTTRLTSDDHTARDIIAIFRAYGIKERCGLTQKELNAMAAQLSDLKPESFKDHWSKFENGPTGHAQALQKAERKRDELLPRK